MNGPSHPREATAVSRNQGLEVADLIRRYGDQAVAAFGFSPAQRRVMRRIAACRTEALGGHLDACTNCGTLRPSYNSCRDRHCPKCQATRQARWLALRLARILPVPHYHVVFTLPGALRSLARSNRRAFYNLLFTAASQTLKTFGGDPKWLGGQLGFTAVLHTWTRELTFHPHLHCIVTAGGLSKDGTSWREPRHGHRFLFPVGALSKVFAAKVLAGLWALRRSKTLTLSPRDAHLATGRSFRAFMGRLHRARWVVYAKRPFAGARHVFAYLGRYTHRVAISNQRLLKLDDQGVHFVTKDSKVAVLEPTKFIQRFLDHVLPHRFVKIRHYGLYASANVKTRLELARNLLPPEAASTAVNLPGDAKTIKELPARDLMRAFTGVDIARCPHCSEGTMLQIELIAPSSPRGPP